MSGIHLSKEFFELLKAIGESKSKQEEDRIIQREVVTLKRKLESLPKAGKSPGSIKTKQNKALASKKKAKEFLVRLLYVEMLGHDGSFGYIKAVELAAAQSIAHKRTGYLVCGACLPPSHEFRFMLVNQMQRDLSSSNLLEVTAAVLAVTRIITGDMVPAISGQLEKLLQHDSELVRKKAIVAFHRFHQIAPEAVGRNLLVDKLRKTLCDRDPSVMAACLNVVQSMASHDATPFKDLIPSLISILKQVIEHRLPTDYDYHRLPAPWIQMKLVRILGILGSNDANASNGVYEILSECMKKADTGINAGYAVVYECVRTITAIYPNPTLLDAAAEAISRFISSKSQNLKYLGVTGLAAIVEAHPQYAATHQLAVIECLEDRDETLQRKTLDLLYRMTNPVNVEFITAKLLDFLRSTTDLYLKKDLTLKICRVAERYAPSNTWYVTTITDLFGISGDLVEASVAQNLMSLIAEGTGDDDAESEAADMELRREAVEIYVSLLDKPLAKLPRILLETMAWCLGEYGYLSVTHSLEDVLVKLCTVARLGKTKLTSSTRKFLVEAIFKLVAQAGTCPPHAALVIDDYTKSRDVDLQQRCLEFQSLLTSAAHMLGYVLPVDASCEDVDVDIHMTFLNGYVSEALSNGARQYSKPEEDDDDEDYAAASGLSHSAFKMTPYEKPQTPSSFPSHSLRGMGSAGSGVSNLPPGVTPPPGGTDPYGSLGGGSADVSSHHTASSGASGEPTLQLRNVANVWGKGGLSQPAAAPEPPAPSYGSHPAPAPASHYGASPSPWATQAAPPPEPEKPRELTEKERMAAALFGGMVPGVTAPKLVAHTPAPPSVPPPAPPTTAAPPVPVAAPPIPAAAPPAPEIDLLDMGFSSDPTPPAPMHASTEDIFASTPMVPTQLSAPPEPPAPPPPPPAAPPVELDPFASMAGLSDAPLASLSGAIVKLEYNGSVLNPLSSMTTAQFGAKWGSCPHTSPITVQAANLDLTLETCKKAGLAVVETIPATQEGICAGELSSETVLIHAKWTSPTAANLTVKSTDATVGGRVALHLQSQFR